MKKPRKRGGKRPGAGRPPGSTHIDPYFLRIRISTRLPQYLVDWLRDQPIPMGRVIELALDEYITAKLSLEDLL
jgi:hypothetical protein